MSKKKIVTIFIIGCIFLVSVFSSLLVVAVDSVDPEFCSGNVADWTVMYYMCGDNHISYEVDTNLADLKKVGSSSKFHLIALKDQDGFGDSALYYINKDSVTDLNWPDEVDMSSPNTLKSFLTFVYNTYPANNYALFIKSDCGSSWQGCINDRQGDTRKTAKLISYPEFADILKDVTKNGEDKLDVLIFGPCICQALEAGYELSPYVGYMVASEEHMLEDLDKGHEYVLKYLETTWNLKNNTHMTPKEFALSLVEFYTPCDFPMFALYLYMVIVKKGNYGTILQQASDAITQFMNRRRNPNYHLIEQYTTLSAIDLCKTSEVVKAIDNLSSLLILHENDEDVNSALKYARSAVREYGKFYVKNRRSFLLKNFYLMLPMEKYAQNSFIDVYHFTDLVCNAVENQAITDACFDLMEKVNSSVIANKVMPGDDSNGFTIYFPDDGRFYNRYLWGEDPSVKYESLQLSKNSLWNEFLQVYLDIR